MHQLDTATKEIINFILADFLKDLDLEKLITITLKHKVINTFIENGIVNIELEILEHGSINSLYFINNQNYVYFKNQYLLPSDQLNLTCSAFSMINRSTVEDSTGIYKLYA
jgi:hypothetical protein